MRPSDEEIAALETAYRKAFFTVACHLAFLAVCCIGAFAVRKMIGMPPAFLTLVLIVSFVLFGGDIFRFLRLRNRMQRLRDEDEA